MPGGALLAAATMSNWQKRYRCPPQNKLTAWTHAGHTCTNTHADRHTHKGTAAGNITHTHTHKHMHMHTSASHAAQ